MVQLGAIIESRVAGRYRDLGTGFRHIYIPFFNLGRSILPLILDMPDPPYPYHNGLCQYCPTLNKSTIPMYVHKP